MGIRLVNTLIKQRAKILKHKIENKVNMAEEGFRKNRRTVEATFIIKQVVELL